MMRKKEFSWCVIPATKKGGLVTALKKMLRGANQSRLMNKRKTYQNNNATLAKSESDAATYCEVR